MSSWQRGYRPDGTPAKWHVFHDVDEVAVYRALRGERLMLGSGERRAAIAQLVGKVPTSEIAHRIGCSQRTVFRHLARLRQPAAA